MPSQGLILTLLWHSVWLPYDKRCKEILAKVYLATLVDCKSDWKENMGVLNIRTL